MTLRDYDHLDHQRAEELRAEVERLKAELAESENLRRTMADLLTRTSIALRGDPPPLTKWSWHDLPDRAAAAISAIDVMQRAAAELAQRDG